MTTACPTETTGTAELESLRAILTSLETPAETMDSRARQQAAILAIGRRTSAQPTLAVLLRDAVAMTAEVLAADMYGIAQLVDGGGLLKLTVGTASGGGNIADVPDHEGPFSAENSLAGYAMASACPVWTEALPSERRFFDLFLVKRGVVSALAVPLHLGGKPSGALCVYQATVRPFALDDVRFVETVAHLLSASIARDSLENELRRTRAHASTVLETARIPAVTLDANLAILDINRRCEELSEFSLGQIRSEPFCDTLIAPEDADTVKSILRMPTMAGPPQDFEAALISRSGARTRIVWSWRVLRDKQGCTDRFVLIGAPLNGVAPETTKAPSGLYECMGRVKEALQHVDALLANDAPKRQSHGDARTPETVASSGDSGTIGRSQTSSSEDGKFCGEPSLRANGSEAVAPPDPKSDMGNPDLRRSPRREFRFNQRIGPASGGKIPPERRMIEVECKDISAGGIAFYMRDPPLFNSLVVELGKPPGERYFSAKVVRVSRLDHGGQEAYLVACRFTGRLSP